MSSKKILIIAGDFVEDYEIMVPYQMLIMAGHNVDVVSPLKKKGDYIKTAIHDFEGDQTYSEKRGHNFILNADFSKAKGENYDALVIPGGRSPEYLRLNDKVIELIRHFDKENKPIASICHGPQVLIGANILNGKTLTAYYTLKPDVLLAGGNWVEPDKLATNVIIDDNLVTAPAWSAHPYWMAEFLRLLGTRIEP